MSTIGPPSAGINSGGSWPALAIAIRPRRDVEPADEGRDEERGVQFIDEDPVRAAQGVRGTRGGLQRRVHHRPGEGHEERRRDALAGHVGDDHAEWSTAPAKAEELEEIAADLTGRLVVAREVVARRPRAAASDTMLRCCSRLSASSAAMPLFASGRGIGARGVAGVELAIRSIATARASSARSTARWRTAGPSAMSRPYEPACRRGCRASCVARRGQWPRSRTPAAGHPRVRNGLRARLRHVRTAVARPRTCQSRRWPRRPSGRALGGGGRRRSPTPGQGSSGTGRRGPSEEMTSANRAAASRRAGPRSGPWPSSASRSICVQRAPPVLRVGRLLALHHLEDRVERHQARARDE